jgi:glycosyltransferase involved in cell wall biosynthesis
LPQEVGEAGLLFHPHDIDAMAGAMRSLAADAWLREKLSDVGRERVKRFGPQQFVRALAQAYAYACSAHSLRKAA